MENIALLLCIGETVKLLCRKQTQWPRNPTSFFNYNLDGVKVGIFTGFVSPEKWVFGGMLIRLAINQAIKMNNASALSLTYF